MVNVDAANRLRVKAKELSDQTAGPNASDVIPTRLEPRRRQSDDHRHAAKEGRRRARHSREAAAGRAREMLEPWTGLAPASNTDARRPRLVKKAQR
jgi:hypothetical protein